jgi:hypothetical protein
VKLAIMQPYFFPYLGYFSLIKNTERFILLDTVQFIYHGWIERNRILKPGGGWQYVRVPLLKHSRDTSIKDITINQQEHWQEKLLAQLQHYKKPAPYYLAVIDVLRQSFAKDVEGITELNRNAIKCVCNYLGIRTPVEIFSELGLKIEPPNAPDEWALNISRAIGGVSEYWNPGGGMDIFEKAKYAAHGIELRFQKIVLTEYDQRRAPFESHLSVIDVMMFNSPEQINAMLDKYELL